MSIDVDVNLGNDVKVDAMGLKADVLGSVKSIRQQTVIL